MKMSHARKEYEDFRTLAPDAYEIVLALGKAAAKAGIDKQLLELIKLRASQINGCAFCVQYHILQGKSLGMSADKLNLVVVWREAPPFSARERAALAWTGSADPLVRRRQRRRLRAGERGILRQGTDLSDLGDRLDQCLEQVRRRLSLDRAGAAEDCRGRGGVAMDEIAMELVIAAFHCVGTDDVLRQGMRHRGR